MAPEHYPVQRSVETMSLDHSASARLLGARRQVVVSAASPQAGSLAYLVPYKIVI